MSERWTDKKRGYGGGVSPDAKRLSAIAGRLEDLGNLSIKKSTSEGPDGTTIVKRFGMFEKQKYYPTVVAEQERLRAVPGAWSGDMNNLFLTEEGVLVNEIFHTPPPTVKVFRGYVSGGVDGVMSWGCTKTGKLMIWGGSYLYSGGRVRSSPLIYFTKSFSDVMTPLHILSQFKIRHAQFVGSSVTTGNYGDSTILDAGNVQLIFITFDDKLYLYNVNPATSWGRLDLSTGYYFPLAILTLVDTSVKTARITHGGFNAVVSSDANYDYVFEQVPLSLVWLKKNGAVWAQGLNVSGEHGIDSIMSSEAYYPPVFTSPPTFEQYVVSQGYTLSPGITYAQYLMGYPQDPNSIYLWGEGGVSVITGEGRGMQTYYNDYYIPNALWSQGNWAFPIFNSSVYKTKRKVLDGPYLDLTTIGYKAARDWVARTEHYWVSMDPAATFLIDKDQKLYAMGLHGVGQLGDYSIDWYTGGVYPPGSNITEHSTWVHSETPLQLFNTKLFSKLHKTNTLISGTRDQTSGVVQLQSAGCTDGYTYSWGAGVTLNGQPKYSSPHKLNLESVKFFDRGGGPTFLGEYTFDELILVMQNNDVYGGKFYMNSEPTFTFKWNLASIIAAYG
jgi:hypothetical protein